MHSADSITGCQFMAVVQRNALTVPLREFLQQSLHLSRIRSRFTHMHPPRPGLQQGGHSLRLSRQKLGISYHDCPHL